MGDLFSHGRAGARDKQEEIHLQAAYFDAIIACLQAARGKDGIDNALRKSVQAALESFRAYLAWQRQHEAVRNPISYTVKHTRYFAKTLYGMISGNKRSWAFVLAEADRIPGRRVFKQLKRLSPFDGHDIIIVEGGEVNGDFSSFFSHLKSGMNIWKMHLGQPPNAPLFIALKK